MEILEIIQDFIELKHIVGQHSFPKINLVPTT